MEDCIFSFITSTLRENNFEYSVYFCPYDGHKILNIQDTLWLEFDTNFINMKHKCNLEYTRTYMYPNKSRLRKKIELLNITIDILKVLDELYLEDNYVHRNGI